jgi:acyl-CoA-binding protein
MAKATSAGAETATAELQRQFERAAAYAKDNSDNQSAALKLVFYGLYKQATSGDAPVAGPSALFRPVEHLKWQAWNKHRGWSQPRAMYHYVLELQNQTGKAI